MSLHDAVQKTSILCANSEEETGEDEKGDSVDKGIVKLTKVERRAKLKKQKKEAKKQGKELDKAEEVQQTPQAAVLVLSQFFYHSAFFFSFCFVLLKIGKLFTLKEESPSDKKVRGLKMHNECKLQQLPRHMCMDILADTKSI